MTSCRHPPAPYDTANRVGFGGLLGFAAFGVFLLWHEVQGAHIVKCSDLLGHETVLFGAEWLKVWKPNICNDEAHGWPGGKP